ncbi:hypothetical protein GCM10011365_25600 [Marinicella pacifica]|uniref:Uncharacterized protein n=2 Tax=Marinicella pacifica TaxID=1171543 RepID=A0A917CZC5_9GAMM|nr:hypothetical protein GCM10011365_25600 [Marinicella pacifica]
MIGRNVFTLTPKTGVIRDLESAKYSFVDSEFINPRILDDLCGWLSDSGDQIVSINITDSNKSNRYFGDIDVKKSDSGFPIVTCTSEEGWVSHKYIGRSFSGLHIVEAWSNGGGSGIFCNVLLVTLSLDSALEYDVTRYEKKSRYVIKLIGSLPLGDRYDGEIGYKFGILTIPACKGRKSLRDKKSRVLVL